MHVVAVQGDENVVHFKYMSLRLRGGFTLACNTSMHGGTTCACRGRSTRVAPHLDWRVTHQLNPPRRQNAGGAHPFSSPIESDELRL